MSETNHRRHELESDNAQFSGSHSGDERDPILLGDALPQMETAIKLQKARRSYYDLVTAQEQGVSVADSELAAARGDLEEAEEQARQWDPPSE